MTPHTRKRKAFECRMGRDEAPAMAPETERPWHMDMQASSDGASARDVVQETHDVAKSDLSRTCSFPLVAFQSIYTARKTVTKYGASDEFLRLRDRFVVAIAS